MTFIQRAISLLAALLVGATLTACAPAAAPGPVEVAECFGGERLLDVGIYSIHPAGHIPAGPVDLERIGLDILLQVDAKSPATLFTGVDVKFDGTEAHPLMFWASDVGIREGTAYIDERETPVDTMGICHSLAEPVSIYVRATNQDIDVNVYDVLECEIEDGNTGASIVRSAGQLMPQDIEDPLHATPFAVQCNYSYTPAGWDGPAAVPYDPWAGPGSVTERGFINPDN